MQPPYESDLLIGPAPLLLAKYKKASLRPLVRRAPRQTHDGYVAYRLSRALFLFWCLAATWFLSRLFPHPKNQLGVTTFPQSQRSAVSTSVKTVSRGKRKISLTFWYQCLPVVVMLLDYSSSFAPFSSIPWSTLKHRSHGEQIPFF